MTPMLVQGLARNFLGNVPSRYKQLVLVFLLINPVLMYTPAFGPTVAAWALIAAFIFTLSMALIHGAEVLSPITRGLTGYRSISTGHGLGRPSL